MKIKFLPIPKAPSNYSFEGQKMTVSYKDKSETFDFSDLPNEFIIDDYKNSPILIVDELELRSSQICRDLHKEGGEIHLVLCQQVTIINGNWTESDWIDSDDYDPNELYIKEVTNEG